MAQSFIDKYVFALMLDSSNFEKGANLATKAANGIKSTLLKTYSIVGGIDLFKNMVTDYTNTARSIDNLNLITGENITTLQAWKKSIQDVGGNVGAFEGTLKGLSQSFANLRQFGQVDERLSLLGWQGIDLYKDGRMKKASEVLLDISKRIKEMSESDAYSWASKLGIDESTYRLFRLHGENLDKIIEKNEKWAVLKKKDIDTTRQYDKIVSDFKNSWLAFSREIMSSVLPVLQKDLFPMIKDGMGYLLQNKDSILDFFKFIATTGGNAAKAVAEVAKGFGLVIDEVGRMQAKNEKKYGTKRAAWETFAEFARPVAQFSPIGAAYYKIADYSKNLEVERRRNAQEWNATPVVNVQNMQVLADDPAQFKEKLMQEMQNLAINRVPGMSTINKLDLGPQIIGAKNL